MCCLHWEEEKEENLCNLHICKLYLLSKCVFNYLKHCIQGLFVLCVNFIFEFGFGGKTLNVYVRTI